MWPGWDARIALLLKEGTSRTRDWDVGFNKKGSYSGPIHPRTQV